jgi:ferrous iron transport protein A
MTTSPTETDLPIPSAKAAPAAARPAAGSTQHNTNETSHAPMRVLVPLDQVPVGTKAMISAVSGETALRRRLLEMGLGPGLVVHLIRRAPMGDPLEIHVRDYQLSLRGDQAKLISVIPV